MGSDVLPSDPSLIMKIPVIRGASVGSEVVGGAGIYQDCAGRRSVIDSRPEPDINRERI